MYPIGSAGSGAPEGPITTWLGKAWQKKVFGAWVIEDGLLLRGDQDDRVSYRSVSPRSLRVVLSVSLCIPLTKSISDVFLTVLTSASSSSSSTT